MFIVTIGLPLLAEEDIDTLLDKLVLKNKELTQVLSSIIITILEHLCYEIDSSNMFSTNLLIVWMMKRVSYRLRIRFWHAMASTSTVMPSCETSLDNKRCRPLRPLNLPHTDNDKGYTSERRCWLSRNLIGHSLATAAARSCRCVQGVIVRNH